MIGYRFYLEHGSKQNKRKGIDEGNVFAVADVQGDDYTPIPSASAACGYVWEGVGAVYDHKNSAACWCATDVDRIHNECTRISEAKARAIHPRLFEWLDAAEGAAVS